MSTLLKACNDQIHQCIVRLRVLESERSGDVDAHDDKIRDTKEAISILKGVRADLESVLPLIGWTGENT